MLRVQCAGKFEFVVEDGSLVFLIGTNGSGKTTLLKNISGAIRPALYKVEIDGIDVSNLSASEMVKRGVVLVPEGKANFPELTVGENLRLGAYIAGVPKSRRGELFGFIYSLFPSLKDREGQIARVLSGGEQRMLAIARGLAANPKILLLDEPSLGLAPKAIESIYSALVKIKETGKTIVIAEQGISAVLSFRDFVDEVYFMSEHQITFRGGVDEIEGIEEIRKVYFGV